MNKDFEIRLATKEDVDEIMNLHKFAGKYVVPLGNLEILGAVTGEEISFVCLHEDKIVGCMLNFEYKYRNPEFYPKIKTENKILIFDDMIVPDFRGNKIQVKFLFAALVRAKMLGYGTVIGAVHEDNKISYKNLVKVGFKLNQKFTYEDEYIDLLKIEI